MNRDIWVVTFDDDAELFLLKKQIESLIIHSNKLTYNIIINSSLSHNKTVRKKMKQNGLYKLLETANFNYNIFKRSDFLAEGEHVTSLNRDDYIAQQLLKLQIYKKSQFKEHLVLDSKNILLNSKSLEINEPNEDISLPINFFACYEHFIKLWHKGNMIPVKGTFTPFLLKSNILESLELHFGTREKYIKALTQPFYLNIEKLRILAEKKYKDLLCDPDCLSEFLIYNLYEQKINNNYAPLSAENAIKLIHQASNQLFPDKIVIESDVLAFHRRWVRKLGIKNTEEIINHYQRIKSKPLTLS